MPYATISSTKGWPITGVADGTTLARMRIWTTRPATPAPTCYVWFYVRRGTTGRPAQCVERRLVQLGYSLTGPDYDFDGTAVTPCAATSTSRVCRSPVSPTARRWRG